MSAPTGMSVEQSLRAAARREGATNSAGGRLLEQLRASTATNGEPVQVTGGPGAGLPVPLVPKGARAKRARVDRSANAPTAAAVARARMGAGADIAPLHTRLGLLQVLRVAIAVIVTGAAFLLPRPIGPHVGGGLAALSLAYAAASTLVEGARRRLGLRSARLVGGLILFDGAYLAVVMSVTGGPRSVLSFLILMHVIAVTLLLSFRNGLKAALWHALLLFVTSWLAEAGVIADRPAASPAQAAELGALALLLVAVATAWFSSLNEGELRRGKAEMRALADMTGRMAATRDPALLVQALLEGVAEAFGRRRAAVVLTDAETGKVASAFELGPDGSVREVATGPASSAAVLAPAGGAHFGPRLLGVLDPDHQALLATALPDASNVMVAPLLAEGRPIGALAVEQGGGSRARVTARRVDLLAQFAGHAALALRAAALQAEVERLARTDALTGLGNRRSFTDDLDRELAAAVRRSGTCALIVLDVDHFKAVNDTHGHQVGDVVLEEVGWALATAARESDIVTRYGGEEFAVILPACLGPEALAVAERLRAAVAEASGPVPVTMSAGVAVFPTDGTEAMSLVAAADSALYKAKRQGRDRSVRFRRPRSLVEAAAS